MTNREALTAMTNWELALWIIERIQTAFYWGETPDADAEYKWLNEEAEFCDRHECREQIDREASE